MERLRVAFKDLEIDYLNTQKKLVEKELKNNTETGRVLECLLQKISDQIQVAASTVFDGDSDWT